MSAQAKIFTDLLLEENYLAAAQHAASTLLIRNEFNDDESWLWYRIVKEAWMGAQTAARQEIDVLLKEAHDEGYEEGFDEGYNEGYSEGSGVDLADVQEAFSE